MPGDRLFCMATAIGMSRFSVALAVSHMWLGPTSTLVGMTAGPLVFAQVNTWKLIPWFSFDPLDCVL